MGCFLGELLTGDVLFRGDDKEKRQMEKIVAILGSIHDHWPLGTSLRFYNDLCTSDDHTSNTLRQHVLNKSPATSDAALDLLAGLLAYDPEERLTASQALNHEYFSEGVGEERDMPAIDQETHGGMNLAMHQKAVFQQQQQKFKATFNSQKGFSHNRAPNKSAN